jgi:hypothetical protein
VLPPPDCSRPRGSRYVREAWAVAIIPIGIRRRAASAGREVLEFYDRVPLNVYGFNRYPDPDVTLFNPNATISARPYLCLNTLGQNRVRFPFVNQQPIDGNFCPRSAVWSAQVEQPMGRYLKLRATYLRNDSDGLVVFDRVAPAPGTSYLHYPPILHFSRSRFPSKSHTLTKWPARWWV